MFLKNGAAAVQKRRESDYADFVKQINAKKFAERAARAVKERTPTPNTENAGILSSKSAQNIIIAETNSFYSICSNHPILTGIVVVTVVVAGG